MTRILPRPRLGISTLMPLGPSRWNPCDVSSLVSRAGRGDEQGRVQGAASAVESLGRTIGPVWGNASLQRFGEATPFYSGAAFLVLALLFVIGHRVADE